MTFTGYSGKSSSKPDANDRLIRYLFEIYENIWHEDNFLKLKAFLGKFLVNIN